MYGNGLGIVVIGRNEGERLKQCFNSLPIRNPVVYVDSGSTDGSVEFAHSRGLHVVALDMSLPFTAARARNAGWHFLVERYPDLEFIQFIDGDCEIHASWFEFGQVALSSECDLVAVLGRLRERYPERSIYNRLCDEEWNVPVGIVDHCGGNAMIRRSVLEELGGFDNDLIAGEEPDFCLRASLKGYQVRRIEAEMGMHDAAMYKFGSWWRRTKRSGYAYAEHVWLHRERSFLSWRRQLFSIVFWALGLPGATLTLSSLIFDSLYFILTAGLGATAIGFWLQIVRISYRKYKSGGQPWLAIAGATSIMLGKIPQALGVLTCWINKVLRRRQGIIEHRAALKTDST